MKKYILSSIIFVGTKMHGMTDITIVKATSSDIEQIARVHHLSWQAEFSGMLAQEVVDKMSYEFCVSFWKKYFENGGSSSETCVAKVDDTVAGFVAILKDANSGDSEIDKIYVNPSHQGLGIGSRLVKYVLEKLESEGFKKTIVKVFVENKKAQKFYEKLGGVYTKDEDIVDYHSIIKTKVYVFSW